MLKKMQAEGTSFVDRVSDRGYRTQHKTSIGTADAPISYMFGAQAAGPGSQQLIDLSRTAYQPTA